jgi:hypothetical protein
MNKTTFRKKFELNIIFCLVLTFLLTLSIIVVEAEYPQEDIQLTPDFKKGSKYNYDAGWQQLTNDGFGKKTNIASRGIAIYKGELYIGTQNTKLPKFFYNRFPEIAKIIYQLLPNIIPKLLQRNAHLKLIFRFAHYIKNEHVRQLLDIIVHSSDGCEIWKYNYTTDSLTQIVGDQSITGMKSGFNYPNNCLAGTLREFKKKLYVGTCSTPLDNSGNGGRKGGEIWRYDGTKWEQIVGHNAPLIKGGFGNPDNVGIFDFEEFNGYLYTGTMNWNFGKNGGCEVWRTLDGLQWEQVVEHGFRPNMSEVDIKSGITNTYCWRMEVFKDHLYAGTFNSCYKFYTKTGVGCQLWRTKDGREWEKVELPNGNGFGEKENYGIRTMAVYNNELYIGTAANLLLDKGCEIWKYDGVNWTPIIGDEVPGVEPTDNEYLGFGNPLNKYAWSMTVTSDKKLWVGTANGKLVNLMEPKSSGCEVWCYDGVEWTPVVKDGDNEKQSGFGQFINEGARSIIEYPEGSGNIVVGTFKLISTRPLMPQEGLELWMRTK